MPFTIAHAVLAPPLAKLFRQQLPMAGLVVGCMAPDLIRLFTEDKNNNSHHWSGLIFPDLYMGLLFSLCWYFILRPVLYDYFKIKQPLNIYGLDAGCKFILQLIVAILLGEVTHILWDGMTHADTKNLFFRQFLEQSMNIWGLNTHVYMVMQIASSIVPLPIIGYMMLHFYKAHVVHETKHIIPKTWVTVLLLSSCAMGMEQIVKLILSYRMGEIETLIYSTISNSIFTFFRVVLIAIICGGGILRIIYNKELRLRGLE